MRILGIDPGYDRLGIAVIEKPAEGNAGAKDVLLYSSCFQTSAKDPIYERLLAIGEEIGRILDEFEPEIVALETLFVTKNQKTAMRVAEARGIIIYEASKRGLEIREYGPMEIKTAITGNGRSDKVMMTKMVKILIDMPTDKGGKKALDDEFDAIAVAIACSAMRGR